MKRLKTLLFLLLAILIFLGFAIRWIVHVGPTKNSIAHCFTSLNFLDCNYLPVRLSMGTHLKDEYFYYTFLNHIPNKQETGFLTKDPLNYERRDEIVTHSSYSLAFRALSLGGYFDHNIHLSFILNHGFYQIFLFAGITALLFYLTTATYFSIVTSGFILFYQSAIMDWILSYQTPRGTFNLVKHNLLSGRQTADLANLTELDRIPLLATGAFTLLFFFLLVVRERRRHLSADFFLGALVALSPVISIQCELLFTSTMCLVILRDIIKKQISRTALLGWVLAMLLMVYGAVKVTLPIYYVMMGDKSITTNWTPLHESLPRFAHVQLILFALGLIFWRRYKTRSAEFWLVISVALSSSFMYIAFSGLPFEEFVGRGNHLTLILLAAVALKDALDWLLNHRTKIRFALGMLGLVCVLSSAVAIIKNQYIRYSQNRERWFDQDRAHLFQWLNSNSTTNSVIATLDADLSFHIPIYTHNRLYNPTALISSTRQDEIINRFYEVLAFQNVKSTQLAGWLRELRPQEFYKALNQVDTPAYTLNSQLFIHSLFYGRYFFRPMEEVEQHSLVAQYDERKASLKQPNVGLPRAVDYFIASRNAIFPDTTRGQQVAYQNESYTVYKIKPEPSSTFRH